MVQLEVRPSDPYSVNVWSVGIDADLYVATREEGDRVAQLAYTPPTARVKVDAPTRPMPMRKSLTANPYPSPVCLECLRRPSVRWLLPVENICRLCIVRSAIGILGFLLMVGGWGYALWTFAMTG